MAKRPICNYVSIVSLHPLMTLDACNFLIRNHKDRAVPFASVLTPIAS
jgi:hypothetical protein